MRLILCHELKRRDALRVESPFVAKAKLRQHYFSQFRQEIANIDEISRHINMTFNRQTGRTQQKLDQLLTHVDRGEVLLVHSLGKAFSPMFCEVEPGAIENGKHAAQPSHSVDNTHIAVHPSLRRSQANHYLTSFLARASERNQRRSQDAGQYADNNQTSEPITDSEEEARLANTPVPVVTKPQGSVPQKNKQVLESVESSAKSPLGLAKEKISELPEGQRDNYHAYTNAKGKVIVCRRDGKKPPKLRFENGELVEGANHIEVFNKVSKKIKIKHSDLSKEAQEELKELEGKRNEAVKTRDAAILSGNKADLRKAQNDMRKASKLIGETAARIHVENQYPGATRLESNLPGNGEQGQFDQVYLTKEGKVLIIEAKGGSSTWGSRKAGKQRAQQGSKKYMDSIIENYTDKLGILKNSPLYKAGDKKSVKKAEDIQSMLRKLKVADMKKKIEYIGVQQKASDAGLTDSINVTHFDIG